MSTNIPPPVLPNTNTSPPRTPITLRRARLFEHPQIASLLNRAFYNDILFGQTIHPHRDRYPHDPSRYWLSRNVVTHFDWSHLFLVAVIPASTTPTLPSTNHQQLSSPPPSPASSGDRIIGVAHWSRIGLSPLENAHAGWGLHRWYDPRRLLRPLISSLVHLLTTVLPIFRNRAAAPSVENIVERSYGFLDHVWSPAKQRCPSLYLECLGVDPDFQGQGVGRVLVEGGLGMAESMGISASVISADGKEGFYRRCGFDVGPVGRSGEGEGNPLWGVPGGMVFFREAPRKVAGDDEKEKKERAAEVELEVDEALKWLRKDHEAGWPSVWLDEKFGRPKQ